MEVAQRERPTDEAGTDELLRAYEELAVAEEELRSQNEELIRTHQVLMSERARYHHLFEHAPVPYLVTDEYGVIREGNHTLAVLLRTRRQRLLGKPFAVFVQDASRRRFRAALNALNAHSDSATVSLNIVRQGARIVAGGAAPGVQLDVTDVVLGDALRAVAAMAAPQAASRNVTLAVEHASASILARADSERLSQILLNLVGNAIKFTPPGGRIAISSRATTTDAIVEIADTGLGIPEEKREEIFKPFSRLRTSTAPGTGLGLAISRDLARAMRGDITVANADEGGSRFVLRLPRSTRFAVEPDLG